MKVILSKTSKEKLDNTVDKKKLCTVCKYIGINSLIVVSSAGNQDAINIDSEKYYGVETTFVIIGDKYTQGHEPVDWYAKHITANGTEDTTIITENTISKTGGCKTITLTTFLANIEAYTNQSKYYDQKSSPKNQTS